MSDLKLKSWVSIAASIALSACSPNTANQARQITIASPLAADAVDFQAITGFDIYVDQGNLHAVITAQAANSKQTLIGYLHSEDGGQSWSAVQNIGAAFNLPVESKLGNDIQIASSGKRRVVIWQTTGEIPGMGPLVTIYSNDDGQTWQRGSNPTGAEIDQSHHDLAADVQGNFHLVWLDDREENAYQGLRYARSADSGQHWQLSQTLDQSSCSCCWNRLLVNDQGQVNALYRDMEFRDMALAQSTNNGETWQRLSTVGEFNWKFEGCPHNGGGISQAKDGEIHSVIWTGAENQAGMYHLQSADNGKSWSQPQAVAAGSGAFHGDIAALDSQRVAMIWDAMGPEGSTVMLADSMDNGKLWSTPLLLSTVGISASYPRIVATKNGWLALWTEQQADKTKHWLSAVIQ